MGSEKLVMPVQRVEGLVITEAGDDVLIYDQNSYSLHTLNKQSYQVWQHCDGIATVDSVAAVTGMSVDVVKRALTQLEEVSLLEAPLDESLRSNESRRSFMKKVGIAASVPAIVSVTAPMAAMADSCSLSTPLCGPGTEDQACRQPYGGADCGWCWSEITTSNPPRACDSVDDCGQIGPYFFDLCVIPAGSTGTAKFCSRRRYDCV